jgi:transcriptional regulator with XRE-family HTH domain
MRRGRDKLAARRRAVGHTQESLAEVLDVAVSTVARWEQGGGCPLPALRRPLAEALSVSLEDLDRLLRGETTALDKVRPPSIRLHYDQSRAEPRFHEGNISLQATRAMITGPVNMGGTAQLPLAISTSDDASEFALITDGVGSDAAAMRAFRAADRQVGGAHLYATVVRYLQTDVAPRLFGTARSADSKLTFTAAAGLTEMAGWMAHDAGHDPVATQHFERALDLVNLGEDHQLGAHVLGSMSHLADHLGRPEEAIGLARAGQEMARVGPYIPSLHAHLLAMEARGLAALGDSPGCARILVRAETALEGEPADMPSPWISHFDEGSLASEAARCMHQLGHLDEAQRRAERIIEVRPIERARSRALGHLLLASVLVARGSPEEACEHGYAVLTTTPSLGSFIVVRQLQRLQQRLEQHRSIKAVAEFLSCLTKALNEWRWLDSCLPAGELGHPWEGQREAPADRER